jgi:hypothetical protein
MTEMALPDLAISNGDRVAVMTSSGASSGPSGRGCEAAMVEKVEKIQAHADNRPRQIIEPPNRPTDS